MSRVLPILFNIDMVRAILGGRKTVTRLCVKPQSKNACGFYVTFRKSDNAFMGVYDYDENERQFDNSQTPPAQVGDILYVRETWQYCCRYTKHSSIIHSKYCFKASVGDCPFYGCIEDCGQICKWRPSIHMPKEAARIWLRVTDVRVERLQDITEDDAKAEGANWKNGKNVGWEEKMKRTAIDRFVEIWNSTIKKSDLDTYGWEANPWVWRIEFERCEKPEEV